MDTEIPHTGISRRRFLTGVTLAPQALAAAGGGIGTPHIVARETPCRLCPDFPCAQACAARSATASAR